MYTSDAKEFSKLIAVLGELYDKPLTKAFHEIYWITLFHYELEDIEKAIQRHISNPDTGQFMPKPADLIRALEGDTETRAKVAWTKVDKALRVHGPYQTIVFDDPIIHKVIADIGGWTSFQAVTGENWNFISHDFVKRYRGYSTQPSTQYPEKLIGIIEKQNCLIGGFITDPILVGDKNKAQKVLAHGKSPQDTSSLNSIQTLALEVISKPNHQSTQ